MPGFADTELEPQPPHDPYVDFCAEFDTLANNVVNAAECGDGLLRDATYVTLGELVCKYPDLYARYLRDRSGSDQD